MHFLAIWNKTCVSFLLQRTSPATSVVITPAADGKSNIAATEVLQQTQLELLKLKQRKEELEKELKMLRPKLEGVRFETITEKFQHI